jgi:hypothetical protein
MKTRKAPRKEPENQRARDTNSLTPPNRTIDESPLDSEATTRRSELRDPVNAPGQLPKSMRKNGELRADEYYGQTEIPSDESEPAQEGKRTSKQSARKS